MSENIEPDEAIDIQVEIDDSTIATPTLIIQTATTRRSNLAPLPDFVEDNEEQTQGRSTTSSVRKTSRQYRIHERSLHNANVSVDMSDSSQLFGELEMSFAAVQFL